MVLGVPLSIVLSIGAVIIASVFVFLEQWKGRKPFRSWKLWLALGLLIVSPTATLVEYISSTRLERERQADFKLLQRLESGLNSLCFEVSLREQNPRYRGDCYFQLETSLRVADLRTTGMFANYLHIRYSPERGWHREKGEGLEWPSTILSFDSSRGMMRFEMSPFGAMWKDQLAWKAERLTDLSQIRMSVSLNCGINPNTWILTPDTMWSPVKSISLFANDYQPEDLITILTPRQRSYGPYFNCVYFHPERQPVKDTDNFSFNVDLLTMRSKILESLAEQ